LKKIAIINNKGGVGKSTTAVQLSHGLAKLDFKVLLTDLDGQNDSSLFLGFTEEDYNKTIFDLLDNHNPAKLEECIIEARENLDLLPNSNIETIDREFHRMRRVDTILDRLLVDLEGMDYDFVIMDCQPSKTRINDAVLCYIDHIVMPVQVEIASVRAVKNIYDYLRDLDVSEEKVSLIIPNMYTDVTNDAEENLKLLHDIFEDNQDMITKPIYRRVRITEAGKHGKTVFEYDEEAAKQFHNVIEKVVEKIA